MRGPQISFSLYIKIIFWFLFFNYENKWNKYKILTTTHLILCGRLILLSTFFICKSCSWFDLWCFFFHWKYLVIWWFIKDIHIDWFFPGEIKFSIFYYRKCRVFNIQIYNRMIQLLKKSIELINLNAQMKYRWNSFEYFSIRWEKKNPLKKLYSHVNVSNPSCYQKFCSY